MKPEPELITPHAELVQLIKDGQFFNFCIAFALNKGYRDTVLRVGKKNQYVTDGIIKIKEAIFLGKKCWASKANRKTYFGKCSTCLEMCGLHVKGQAVSPILGIVKQLPIFAKSPNP